MSEILNDYIPAKKLAEFNRFVKSLAKFEQECESVPALYEDSNTRFFIRNVRIENGAIVWDEAIGNYAWSTESLSIVLYDFEEDVYWFDEYEFDEQLDYWKECLRRAKRYWRMDSSRLDKIQDGVLEDKDDE